jgi:hypothetical protein
LNPVDVCEGPVEREWFSVKEKHGQVVFLPSFQR